MFPSDQQVLATPEASAVVQRKMASAGLTVGTRVRITAGRVDRISATSDPARTGVIVYDVGVDYANVPLDDGNPRVRRGWEFSSTMGRCIFTTPRT
ncbi:hypothetical protein [Rhodococcus opacus]|uniref:hypothetical protein n=1 Tax=Rhodococcus opacus TaxID=37919 RepID=UPI001B3470F8|nr:hypothetical protein [Rhodococcus opacus]MDX5964945.1 hypothetical protein [Rhodococcus opacus]UZG52455.1 hypothetical protein ONE62_19865 [Rhodococcus opacus]CAG7623051.1 hypothetical protein E143388_06468 [Rhodococcus opacus]